MRVLADPSGAPSAAIVIAWSLISAAAYFTPAIVALVRRVPNAGSVIVIDLLLGWTIVGWIVALAMACRSKAPRHYAPGYYPPPPHHPQENGRGPTSSTSPSATTCAPRWNATPPN